MEQRRGNRLAALIGMVAIMLTICNFIYKKYLQIVNVWPIKGLVYGYMHFLMTILFANMIVIILYALLCCIIDLLRFNVFNRDYKKYDKYSDKIFSILIEGTKCGLIIFALVASNIYLVLFIDNHTWKAIILGIAILIIIAICAFRYFILMVRKNKSLLLQYVFFLLPCVFFGVLIYADGLLKVAAKTESVTYYFEEDGTINIYEEGVKADIIVEICNEKKETIYSTKLYYDDFMKSYQKIDISSDNDGELIANSEGTKIDSEIIEGFIQLKIKKYIKNKNYYSLNLYVYNRNKRSIVYNNFKYDGVFAYAKNKIRVDF